MVTAVSTQIDVGTRIAVGMKADVSKKLACDGST